MSNWKSISPSEVGQNAGALLLDVRTPAEYEEIHAPGAMLQPLAELDPGRVAEQAGGRPVYVICRTGSRARQACGKLASSGISVFAVVEGGMEAWEAAGLPVVRGRKTLSLERQVRIAAGSLVIMGTALGVVVHPAFLGLSAFVGCGLVFAGITDWCGMGLLLARMPWNQ